MAVRILVTGGTFDKVHDPIKEALVFRDTAVPEILEVGRSTCGVAVEKLMLLDSMDMNDADRMRILEKCQNCGESRIVVTHGTSTILETAKLLGRNVKGKTVVITGAMVPHSIKGSDAAFNLAYALGAAHSLPEGVYVAMNGRVFGWDGVRKDAETGVFKRG